MLKFAAMHLKMTKTFVDIINEGKDITEVIQQLQVMPVNSLFFNAPLKMNEFK